MPRTGRPSNARRIDNLLTLMGLLSTAPGGRLPLATAADELGITVEEAEGLAYELSTLAVRSSGLRAAVTVEHGTIIYQGADELLPPIRLTADETLVLSHILGALDIDAELQDALSDALLPIGAEETAAAKKLVSSTAARGNVYSSLVEAIDLGIRCSILYRKASGDPMSGKLRTIDPLALSEEKGATYLRAWDVERDAMRTFRLDRIESLSFTDTSVERHGEARENLHDTLSASGVRTRLRFEQASAAESLSWAGISRIEHMDDGSAEVEVFVTDPSWLYRNVLAAEGSIEIVSPADMRAGLAAYAQTLKEGQRRSCAFLHSSR